MQRQEAILKRYQQVFPEQKTFKEMAAHTGIQLTRVFRLFNGFKMNLYEFGVFEDLIAETEGKDNSLHALIDECQKFLSKESLERTVQDMKRKLLLKKFTQPARGPFKSPDSVA